MSNTHDDNSFVTKLIEEFPELKDEVLDEDYAGLISLQIGCFRRFTQQAIDLNNLDLVKKCFLFVEAIYDIVNPEVRNLLYISYIGKLKMPIGGAVEKILPERFKQIISELNTYHTSIPKNEKLNKFLEDL
jgi:hypothetical protein